jgi:5S rRNA maturation endonuclease (ribonuclease M5)
MGIYKVLGLKVGEQNLCPFPHKKTKTKEEYMEKIPSCGINEDGKFNCFVCGKGFTSEDWFTATYLNCTLKQAERFNKMLNETKLFLPQKTKWNKHQENLKEELKDDSSKPYQYLKELDMLDMVDVARLGLYQGRVTLPTFYKGQIINICQFCPGEVPKYRNSASAVAGTITTTKAFDKNLDYVMVCAGEKDMLKATQKGFNAISIIGGEKTKPYWYKNLFKGKKVYIIYDNDEAGINGALELAEWLYRYTTQIKILNIGNTYEEKAEDLKAVCKENKEDLFDFFEKYKRTDLDLNNVIDNCRWYQPPAQEHQSILTMLNQMNDIMKGLREKIDEEHKKHK